MRYGLILGDQLSEEIATLKRLDKHEDVILMAELVEETTYVKHHPQKIALIFSAMRHFAKHLKQQGWTVRYQVFDRSKTTNNFLQFLKSQLDKQEAKGLVITECGEYRLQYQMENSWEKELNIPIQILIDDRFSLRFKLLNNGVQLPKSYGWSFSTES
jgi:deoxyribodipyrimidine photolyase-related protein